MSKKHLELFEALTDDAREEFFQDDIKKGLTSVKEYSENGMDLYLEYKDYEFVYSLYLKYVNSIKSIITPNEYFHAYVNLLLNYGE